MSQSDAHTALVAIICREVNRGGRATLWPVRGRHPSRCDCMGLGAPDLIGLLHGSGVMLAGEVKTGSGALRPKQRSWSTAAMSRGALCFVWRSLDEAMRDVSASEAIVTLRGAK